MKIANFLIALLVLLVILPGIALSDSTISSSVGNRLAPGIYDRSDHNSITGTTFLDVNGNGLQDYKESGIPGVTIRLYNSKNKLISQTKTDRNGNYGFDCRGTGTYIVAEVVPDGYVNTTPSRKTIRIDSKTKSIKVNFGNARPSTISGLKYYDLNGNKKYDKGEPGISGWTILLNRSGINVRTTVTRNNGKFQFTNLVPGTYTISEVLQEGYTNTSELSRQVRVNSGQTLNVTCSFGLFGNVPTATHKLGYVVNDGSNNVTVIDLSTKGIVTSIPVGASPWRVAISNDGTRAYVTNQNDNNVSVIDTGTNTVIDSIDVGAFPTGIALTPDGTRAYVTNSGDVTVSAIDTTANVVIATINVGFEPFDVAVTPDGNFAYVTTQEGNVYVIDTATNTVTDIIAVGSGPAGIAITPDGVNAYVYVTNEFSADVSVIALATNTVVATIPVGFFPNSVAITPDSSRSYVTNLVSGSISVIDTATNTVTTTIPGISTPADIAISPDGAFAYVTSNADGVVRVIDTATNTIVGSPIPVGSNPQGIAISPDP